MPDALDVCVATATAVALGIGFLCWAAVGNAVAGRKVDFFHPLTPKTWDAAWAGRDVGPGAAHSATLLKAYMLAYLAVVAAVLAQWGKLRRAILEKLIETFAPITPATAITLASSTASGMVAACPTPSGMVAACPTLSATSLTPKTSRKRMACNRSRSTMRRSITPEKERKVEIPSVMRSSVVASGVIPPLPRMSMSEETDEKLSRVLKKFENIDNTSMGQASEDSLQKGKKKA